MPRRLLGLRADVGKRDSIIVVARARSILRLFLAAYPSANVASQWLDALDKAQLPPCRITPLEQIHLTLLFIGDTPARQLETVSESIERACSGIGPFHLTPQNFIALPDEKPDEPARLIAIECDAPPLLLELQRRLAARLAGKPRTKQGKPFRPHFTLCRFRPPVVLEQGLSNIPLAKQPIAVNTIHLMRSTLKPTGAQHDQVGMFELKA